VYKGKNLCLSYGSDAGPGNDPFWARVVCDERLLEIARSVLGEGVVHHHSGWFIKPPETGRPTEWHQDGGYWEDYLEPRDEVVTLWVAFSEVSPETSCLRVIPESHDSSFLDHGYSPGDAIHDELTDERHSGSDVDPDAVDESNAVDLLLDAGDVSIHHPTILHSSYPNTSERWRYALAIRYTTTDTRFLNLPNTSNEYGGRYAPLLASGSPSSKQVYQQWPAYDPETDGHRPFPDSTRYNCQAEELNGKLDDSGRFTAFWARD
jgi:chlorinating enzyme